MDATTAIRQALGAIAPEADLAELPADADLEDELDLDSMDFLNFLIALGGTHRGAGTRVGLRAGPHVRRLCHLLGRASRRRGGVRVNSGGSRRCRRGRQARRPAPS